MDDFLERLDVRCAMHGPMKYRLSMEWWNCVGFDGEKCSSVLTAEVAYEIMHGGPVGDTRCLPVYWHRNQYTDVLEITLGAKDAQRSAS